MKNQSNMLHLSAQITLTSVKRSLLAAIKMLTLELKLIEISQSNHGYYFSSIITLAIKCST